MLSRKNLWQNFGVDYDVLLWGGESLRFWNKHQKIKQRIFMV